MRPDPPTHPTLRAVRIRLHSARVRRRVPGTPAAVPHTHHARLRLPCAARRPGSKLSMKVAVPGGHRDLAVLDASPTAAAALLPRRLGPGMSGQLYKKLSQSLQARAPINKAARARRGLGEQRPGRRCCGLVCLHRRCLLRRRCP